MFLNNRGELQDICMFYMSWNILNLKQGISNGFARHSEI